MILLLVALLFYVISSYEIVFSLYYNYNINFHLIFKIFLNMFSGFYYLNLYANIIYYSFEYITFLNLFISFFNIGVYLISQDYFYDILLFDSLYSFTVYLLLWYKYEEDNKHKNDCDGEEINTIV